jgi:hypothetical protein
MTYAGGRVIHDADSHIMESPDWLREYADEATRAKMAPPDTSGTKEAEEIKITIDQEQDGEGECRTESGRSEALDIAPRLHDLVGSKVPNNINQL